jgi:phenylacetic acid degradation protein paaN
MARWFEAHRELLERAVAATRTRGWWSPFPEVPSGKLYGESAKANGDAAFAALKGRPFDTGQEGGQRVGKERSPWGIELGITYPACDPQELINRAHVAARGWADASPEDRVGVAIEILQRLNRQSFLMADAVMHTTGQAFVMAFQAGGPHAQDRGLEAVAYAWDAMRAVPGAARWEKPAGRTTLALDKSWRIVPRGLALVIGCATFPTWNSYPGLFASLVTGNVVIVKPHPRAILPLALTVKVGREVLAEAGFDPNVLQLAPDEPEAPITTYLAGHRDMAIIDFTGSPAFGAWLRANAAHARLYTEEAGVNPVIVHSTDDLAGMCRNLAFSLSLYSGQMCTAPRVLWVEAEGVRTDQGTKTPREIGRALKAAIDELLAEPERAAGVLGTIQDPAILDRVRRAHDMGYLVRLSEPVAVPGFPNALTAGPALIEGNPPQGEWFGPIAFLVPADTRWAIDRAAMQAREDGAVTASVYSTDAAVVEHATTALARAGVPVSVNLTGGIYVNQSAAFSDYHVSGLNPAGNACLTDAAFVADRFRVVTIRRPAAAAQAA